MTENEYKVFLNGLEETLNSGVQYFNNADMNIPNKEEDALKTHQNMKGLDN